MSVQVFSVLPRRKLLGSVVAVCHSLGLTPALQPTAEHPAPGDTAPGTKLKPNYNILAALPEAKQLFPTKLGEFWQSDHWPTLLFRSSVCIYDECFSALMCSDINNKHSNYKTFLRKRLLFPLFWGKAEANKCRGNEINLIYCICLLSLEEIHLRWCSLRHRGLHHHSFMKPFRCDKQVVVVWGSAVHGMAKLQDMHVTHSATENSVGLILRFALAHFAHYYCLQKCKFSYLQVLLMESVELVQKTNILILPYSWVLHVFGVINKADIAWNIRIDSSRSRMMPTASNTSFWACLRKEKKREESLTNID